LARVGERFRGVDVSVLLGLFGLLGLLDGGRFGVGVARSGSGDHYEDDQDADEVRNDVEKRILTVAADFFDVSRAAAVKLTAAFFHRNLGGLRKRATTGEIGAKRRRSDLRTIPKKSRRRKGNRVLASILTRRKIKNSISRRFCGAVAFFSTFDSV